MIELLPVSPLLIQTALDEGWFENERVNRVRGFGSGPEGIEMATQKFLEDSKNGMVGIYQDAKAIGWLTVDETGGEGEVEIDLFTRPKHQAGAAEAVSRIVTTLLGQGIRRISVRIPEIDHKGIAFWRKRCRFHREGKSWSALVVDGKEFDTVNFVMTRTLAERRKES